MLTSLVVYAQAPTSGRYAKSPTPHTPMVPLISRAAKMPSFRSNAFSLWAADNIVPRGPFSFLPPDVPAQKGSKPSVSRTSTDVPVLTDEDAADFKPSPPPRFRSALEQVSYFTNESVSGKRHK